MYLKRLQTIWLLAGVLALVTFGPQAARAGDQAAGSTELVELRALINAQNQQDKYLRGSLRISPNSIWLYLKTLNGEAGER